ncbi:MAG: hypothetical protein UT82_C0027G0010 [Parcubacteria group bacterium GW2011_GWB1_40_14]|nr:MAG: hypothetical protein UT82_C0027G0010 [Parcubacteria group bacterium GW2011_GWB1_40_14]
MKKILKNKKIRILIVCFFIFIFYNLIAIITPCGGACLPGYFCMDKGTPIQPDGTIVIVTDSGGKCIPDFGL